MDIPGISKALQTELTVIVDVIASTGEAFGNRKLHEVYAGLLALHMRFQMKLPDLPGWLEEQKAAAGIRFELIRIKDDLRAGRLSPAEAVAALEQAIQIIPSPNV